MPLLSGNKNYNHIDELAIRSKGRPLLFYVKGEYKPEMPFDDVPTGLNEAVVAYYVEILTEPGDLVIDPFSSETTAVMAQRLGRRFVGAAARRHGREGYDSNDE